jgi:putative membrane-bound dehydrogenase-like protein
VGFEIEQVAGPPLTKRPIAAAFDDRGHLFVTEASGTNDPVKKQLVDLPHTLLRLVDRDGGGRFESGGVFANKLMLPEGVMCLGGSVFVGHPPVITKFTDADNDGRPGKRETWFDGKTLTGCANDLHGPYPGPDGWVYWTKGAFARQEYTLPNGKKFSTRAAHIFRARPDGTGIEPVMTGGMDNPVDVAFTPSGERIFTTTFFQRPADGKRDGLIHAVYGGVYGKDHDPVYEHPWTGPDLMPVMTHLGAAAPCGLHRFESDQFGPEYTDNLFACSFNMHKVTRHVLVPDGATFRTVDTDFLVSDSLDFHPTDVIEDADGSLLVVDTGGWYKLCCPTSQLVKPDVVGAIYRIRKKGSHKVEDPRGLKIDWDQSKIVKGAKTNPAGFLDDPRPAVRHRAIELTAARWDDLPLEATRYNPDDSPRARLGFVWAACRATAPGAREQVRAALNDPDKSVRQAAIHAASLWRDKEAVPELLKLLKNPSLHNRRAAAEALGRIGDETAVPAIREALADPATDRVLQHSLTYALIEIGDRTQTVFGLTSRSPRVEASALMALDQMPGGKLEADAVTARLTSPDPEVREAAEWIAGRHPEWGKPLADWLRERFPAFSHDVKRRNEITQLLGRLARSKQVQDVLAEAVAGWAGGQPTVPVVYPDGVLLCLDVMARAGLKEAPSAWLAAIAGLLNDPTRHERVVPAALATLRALPPAKSPPEELTRALVRIGSDPKLPEALRLSALAAVPRGLPKVDDATFAFLLGRLDRGRPIPERAAATDSLADAKLSPEQLQRLAAVLPNTGPLEIGKLLTAFTRTSDAGVGLALVTALRDPKVRPMIRTATVKPVLDKYPANVRHEADRLYVTLDADRAGEAQKLEALLAELKDGNAQRGHTIFNSTKAACFTCHEIGYRGGTVGPDLTKIGGVRTERDLLEAIVFPSASFVRSYEPVKVTTLDGRAFQGTLKADTPDEVVLTVSATEEVRIARNDIDELTPGTVSVMPSGLDQQLTKQELADLIAFLKASK